MGFIRRYTGREPLYGPHPDDGVPRWKLRLRDGASLVLEVAEGIGALVLLFAVVVLPIVGWAYLAAWLFVNGKPIAIVFPAAASLLWPYFIARIARRIGGT